VVWIFNGDDIGGRAGKCMFSIIEVIGNVVGQECFLDTWNIFGRSIAPVDRKNTPVLVGR